MNDSKEVSRVDSSRQGAGPAVPPLLPGSDRVLEQIRQAYPGLQSWQYEYVAAEVADATLMDNAFARTVLRDRPDVVREILSGITGKAIGEVVCCETGYSLGGGHSTTVDVFLQEADRTCFVMEFVNDDEGVTFDRCLYNACAIGHLRSTMDPDGDVFPPCVYSIMVTRHCKENFPYAKIGNFPLVIEDYRGMPFELPVKTFTIFVCPGLPGLKQATRELMEDLTQPNPYLFHSELLRDAVLPYKIGKKGVIEVSENMMYLLERTKAETRDETRDEDLEEHSKIVARTFHISLQRAKDLLQGKADMVI